jgi:hypothetical protein
MPTRFPTRRIAAPLALVSLALLAIAMAIILNPTGSGAVLPGANGKIAFQSDRTSEYEIYVMNANGAMQTDITNDAQHND